MVWIPCRFNPAKADRQRITGTRPAALLLFRAGVLHNAGHVYLVVVPLGAGPSVGQETNHLAAAQGCPAADSATTPRRTICAVPMPIPQSQPGYGECLSIGQGSYHFTGRKRGKLPEADSAMTGRLASCERDRRHKPREEPGANRDPPTMESVSSSLVCGRLDVSYWRDNWLESLLGPR